jgi:hypothetical protein
MPTRCDTIPGVEPCQRSSPQPHMRHGRANRSVRHTQKLQSTLIRLVLFAVRVNHVLATPLGNIQDSRRPASVHVQLFKRVLADRCAPPMRPNPGRWRI